MQTDLDLALEQWLDTDLGRHVLAAELCVLDELLPRLFGYHLLQLGVSRKVRLYDTSPVRHRFRLARLAGGEGVSALSEPEQLPLDADSLDVLLLHHVLEYSNDPHQLLREAARVVIPGGHVVVAGFNPWSLFGACAVPGRRFGHAVWTSRMLGARRVADWLELLGFAVDRVYYRVHGLPVQHPATLARLQPLERFAARWSLPGGAVYLIHARKQSSVLTPVRTLRWSAPRLAAMPLAAPRARHPTLH
jgi:SAM-dependent methyltransferase